MYDDVVGKCVGGRGREKDWLIDGWITSYLMHAGMLSCSVMSKSCYPKDCRPPGFFVHGVSQARTLEWLPCSPPGHLPDPGIKPKFPASPTLAGGFFTTEPPGKPY